MWITVDIKQCPPRHAKGLKKNYTAGKHLNSYTSRNGMTKRNRVEERMVEEIDYKRKG